MAQGENLEAKERELAELRRRLDDEVAKRDRLVEVAGLLSSTLRLDELLELITEAAAEILGAETSSLLLLDDGTGELTVDIATGERGHEVLRKRVPPGVGIAGWVVEHGEPAVVNSPRDDPRFYGDIDAKSGFETRSILAVPMRTKERVIGVIEVINKREGSFDEQDVKLTNALAGQAATTIDNARLYARLADAVLTSRLSYRL
jgi:GAF domain-containing protein